MAKLPYVLLCSLFIFTGAVKADETVTSSSKASVGALLQPWLVSDNSSANNAMNFRIRRAEVSLMGTVGANTRWFLMGDLAKTLTNTTTTTVSMPVGTTTINSVSSTTDNKVLQDLGVAYKLCDGLEFVMGQFKTMTSAEGLENSGELLFPERSMVARTYGDKRATGAAMKWKDSMYHVGAMVSNSSAANTLDMTNGKDVSVRADVMPIDMIKVGGFIMARDTHFNNNRDYGFNAAYDRGGILVRGEFIAGKSGGINSTGWVADAAYRWGDWQPAFRYEAVKANSTVAVEAKGWNAGVNYFVSEHASKFQLSYGMWDNVAGGDGVYSNAGLTANDAKVGVLSYQMKL